MTLDLEACSIPDYEMRIADDGWAYKLSDFQSWYPEDWSGRWGSAQVIPRAVLPPEGLKLGMVDKPLVQSVLDEILPHFPTKEERAALPHRAALEVGWTIDHGSLSSDCPIAFEAQPLHGFPCLFALVCQAMGILGENRENMEHRLNVSCLLYSPGHSIAWHCDRPYCYEEVVFGCVVFNSSDSALEFHEGTESGNLLQRYVVQEEPGVCFAQRDSARYVWKHGVPALGRGERLSVTWRWFSRHVALR